MNSISATRAAAAGLSDRIEISVGDATALTFPDSAFDAAVSTQVIEYLADPDAALVELARVLRPGGRLVLVDTDFDSLVLAATDRDLAARIAAAWDEHLPDPHLPRSLLPRLRAAGFAIQEVRIVPILNTEYEPATFSYNLAALIASFVPGHRGISENDATRWLETYIRLLSASTFATNGFVMLYRPCARTARSPWYQPARASRSSPWNASSRCFR